MKRHIPNAITCCNLLSGCIAIVMALYGSAYSLLFFLLGAAFDFFDGMAARQLGVQSPIGKELDSLADIVTFGVAPATMLYSEMKVMTGEDPHILHVILPFSSFLMVAFSALRLAKFNIDERQTASFLGLPTPANALFWASLLVGLGGRAAHLHYLMYVFAAIVIISCWLMVSEIPMFALKFKHWGWRGNEVKYIFLITCIPILLFFRTTGIAIIIAWYVVLSVLTCKADK